MPCFAFPIIMSPLDVPLSTLWIFSFDTPLRMVKIAHKYMDMGASTGATEAHQWSLSQ